MRYGTIRYDRTRCDTIRYTSSRLSMSTGRPFLIGPNQRKFLTRASDHRYEPCFASPPPVFPYRQTNWFLAVENFDAALRDEPNDRCTSFSRISMDFSPLNCCLCIYASTRSFLYRCSLCKQGKRVSIRNLYVMCTCTFSNGHDFVFKAGFISHLTW